MKKKWKNGYKVVRRQGNRFVSCTMGIYDVPGWKVYGIGHVTRRAKGYIKGIATRLRSYGPLAVFIDKESALRFMEGLGGPSLALFTCRYVESSDNSCWRPGYRCRNLCHIYVSDQRFADEVELLEEVKL